MLNDGYVCSDRMKDTLDFSTSFTLSKKVLNIMGLSGHVRCIPR